MIANPSEAVQISKSYIPGMNVDTATLVLQATIPIGQGSGQLGYNDGATWQSMVQFLAAEKIIPPVQDVTQAYTNTTRA